MLYMCVLIADWLCRETVGGVVGARWERARWTRVRVRARSKCKIRFPLLVSNSNFFPPTFIREGGGCGAKIFSDRRGRGGHEEA
jgi:hypothetical protein